MTLKDAILIILEKDWQTTYHYQVAGDYEGETLTKKYCAGKPSYLAMFRENGDLISLKRDALVIYKKEPTQ